MPIESDASIASKSSRERHLAQDRRRKLLGDKGYEARFENVISVVTDKVYAGVATGYSPPFDFAQIGMAPARTYGASMKYEF